MTCQLSWYVIHTVIHNATCVDACCFYPIRICSIGLPVFSLLSKKPWGTSEWKRRTETLESGAHWNLYLILWGPGSASPQPETLISSVLNQHFRFWCCLIFNDNKTFLKENVFSATLQWSTATTTIHQNVHIHYTTWCTMYMYKYHRFSFRSTCTVERSLLYRVGVNQFHCPGAAIPVFRTQYSFPVFLINYPS